MTDYRLDNNLFFNRSKKYENVYKVLDKILKPYELMCFCATVGFKYNKKSCIEEKGLDTRGSFFKDKALLSMYTVVINDKEIGNNLEAFSNDSFFKTEFKATIEQYAEGGMEILLEEFQSEWGWDGKTILEDYNEYETDLLRFIYDQSNSDTF